MSPTGKRFATNCRDSHRPVAASGLAIRPSSLPGDFDRTPIPKGIIAPRERTSRSRSHSVKRPLAELLIAKSAR